jgi:hypothetical protein
MLKRLVILGLLVLGCGAWPQVPGNGSGQHDKAQDKQETADPSKPVVAVESPAGANKQDQAPQKSAKYPWRELYAPANVPNWALVLVGGITGWFVYKTLKAIKKQADIMERQAKDAQESGAKATEIALATAQAAQKSADVAAAQIKLMKEKERARLALIVKPLNEIEVSDGSGDIEMQIGNFGSTHAFNVRYGMWCEITHSKEEPFDPDPESAVGIIRANAAPERIREGIVTNVSGPQIEANARDFFVHLVGRIEYEDVFGDSHFIRFQYTRPIPRLSEPIERGGVTVFPIVGLSGWKKCAHPEHNTEG